jgi:hypothetical protein
MTGAIILTDEIFCHYNPKLGTIREKEKALKRINFCELSQMLFFFLLLLQKALS